MSEHDDHHHPAPLSPVEVRARALEDLLKEKGLIQEGFVDAIVSAYEKDIGPMNGARVVARAWVDPSFKARLLADGSAAISEFGFGGPEGSHLVVLENSPTVHNVVVCTLCSCYPRWLLGLPPDWYKSRNYRSRVVREPRAVLSEFGLELPDRVAVRVHDSNADMRYLVLPMRPAGTDGWDEERLAGLATRDCMIGVALPDSPRG